MERKHMGQMEKKKTAIEEVRKLYSQGQTAQAISRLTGHTWKTVTNYLKEDCSLNNGHYDQRMPGKLAPYEKTVIDMRSKGITYSKIHEYITEKGYIGTVASLRIFMQKENLSIVIFLIISGKWLFSYPLCYLTVTVKRP